MLKRIILISCLFVLNNLNCTLTDPVLQELWLTGKVQDVLVVKGSRLMGKDRRSFIASLTKLPIEFKKEYKLETASDGSRILVVETYIK